MVQVQKMAQLRDVSDLPEYPISSEDRLDSHYFIQWNLKRWRGSDFRRKVEPEVGWYGFLLFCIAQDASPIGTLPCDGALLAFDLNLTLDRWQALLKRDISPLHGWYKVQCDNGEIRLGHKVVTEVAQEALKSKRSNAVKVELRKLNKRLADLKDMIVNRIGAGQLLKTPQFIERFNEWLEENHPDAYRREPFIREMLDQFQVEMAR